MTSIRIVFLSLYDYISTYLYDIVACKLENYQVVYGD